MDGSVKADTLVITREVLNLIAELDEFKGAWAAIGRISPERLTSLRRVATIESIGSSTRIEGARLTDVEVERLLSDLDVGSFSSRDEEEVAGVMSGERATDRGRRDQSDWTKSQYYQRPPQGAHQNGPSE